MTVKGHNNVIATDLLALLSKQFLVSLALLYDLFAARRNMRSAPIGRSIVRSTAASDQCSLCRERHSITAARHCT